MPAVLSAPSPGNTELHGGSCNHTLHKSGDMLRVHDVLSCAMKDWVGVKGCGGLVRRRGVEDWEGWDCGGVERGVGFV